MNTAEQFVKEDSDELIVIPFYVKGSNESSDKINGNEETTLLCLNVQKVIEVIESKNITHLPNDYFPFVGIYDHRMGPIPIMNVSALLGNKNLSLEGKRVIFCQIHNFVIGILVDGTYRISNVQNKNVLPIPEALLEKNVFFNGMIRYKDTFMHMLDVEGILDKYGVSIEKRSEEFGAERRLSLKEKKILIVEDSDLFRKKLQKLFAKYEANCDFAKDGKEGLEKIKKSNYSYDLIFTDIEMPLMNGIEMIRKAKRNKKFTTPVVFNSSISNPILIEEIEKEKLGTYLVKFSEQSIFQKLSEIESLMRVSPNGQI